MCSRLMEILLRDPVRNANLLYFSKRYGLESIFVTGDSVLARGTSDHTWVYLNPGSESEGRILMDSLTPEDRYLVGMDPWLLTALKDRYEIEWVLSCRKLVWPASSRSVTPSHPVRSLQIGDAVYIYDHSDYKAFTDIPYIEDQICRGVGGGIEGPDGHLAAWALTHDDGAIGFLHVSEPYRKLGYGAALTHWMIQRVQDQGGIPFVHIETTNEKSMNLAMKMGFEPFGEIWWVKGRLKWP